MQICLLKNSEAPPTNTFSIWTLDNELGTFIVRNAFKSSPKRFGLRLADQRISGEPDDLVVDAEVEGLSVTLFDDFGGLMAPLLNVSLAGITLSLHGKFDNLNSTLNLSLVARSYNEKMVLGSHLLNLWMDSSDTSMIRVVLVHLHKYGWLLLRI